MGKRHKWVFIIATLLSILFITLIFFPSRPLLTPVQLQLAAIKSGDFEQAYYSYTSSDFRSFTSLRDFERFVYACKTLNDNAKAILQQTELTPDTGLVEGFLISNDGAESTVKYQLIKENDAWKIAQITLHTVDLTAQQQLNLSLNKTLNNKDNRYIIHYPANWGSNALAEGTVIINGNPRTASSYSSVNIQTVLTKSYGGKFSTIDEFMSEVRHQAAQVTGNAKILKHGPVDIMQADGTKLHGQYIVFTYGLNGKNFKQWQIVVMRNDGRVFYAWAYAAPVEQYDLDLPVAQAILGAWSIY